MFLSTKIKKAAFQQSSFLVCKVRKSNYVIVRKSDLQSCSLPCKYRFSVILCSIKRILRLELLLIFFSVLGIYLPTNVKTLFLVVLRTKGFATILTVWWDLINESFLFVSSSIKDPLKIYNNLTIYLRNNLEL